MDNLVNDLYNNTINIFLSNITSDKEEISMEYRKYIEKRYKREKYPPYEYAKLLEVFSDMLISNFNGLSEDEKKSILLKDEWMDKLCKISEEAINLAKKRMYENSIITEEEKNEKIGLLTKCVEGVREFNKKKALLLLGESITDLNYASNVSENTSLRIGK